jgi:hypothetical protein
MPSSRGGGWEVTGVAWPSSVRVVRCLVESFNERNSCAGLWLWLTSCGDSPRRPSENGGEWERCQVLMALIGWAGNVIQWPLQWEAMVRAGAKPERWPWFGSRAETRPREKGIGSNRESERRGERIYGCCTYCPSRLGRGGLRKAQCLTSAVTGNRKGWRAGTSVSSSTELKL